MNPLCTRLFLSALLLAANAIGMPMAEASTSCTATTTNVAFGTVSTSGMTDVSATFNVTCSTSSLGGNTKVRMCLNIGDGVNGIGFYNPRRMTSGLKVLEFQLYSDAARSQIWGSRGNPTVPNPVLADFDYASIIIFGGSQTRSFTIYGRVPSQTFVSGAYTNPFSGIHTSIEYRYNESILTASYPASCVSGGTTGTGDNFPFTASATVPATCHTYLTTDLNFGNIPGLITANQDQISTISMTCTGGTAWNVGLNNGQNVNGTVRRMRLNATNFVNYELFRDLGRVNRWGSTIGTNTVSGSGNGLEHVLTVYGRVPGGQAVPAGNYSDIVTVTISY